MMPAEISQGTELTNQQKFHRLRPKAIIEVRLISHAGAEPKWFRAKIKDTNKEGAYCQLLDSPHTRFWHWRDVRPCEETELPRVSASLGEVARLHEELHQATEQPRTAPLPPPPALVAALAPVAPISPPAPPVRLIREPAKVETPAPAPTGLVWVHAPAGGELGTLIRAERMRRQMRQVELGKLVTPNAGNLNAYISKVETGALLPTDDDLVVFAESLGLDLDTMIAARDRDKSKRVVQAKHEAHKKQDRERKRALRAEKIHARESLAPTPAPTRAAFAELEDLIEALIAIVPMPGDSEQRRTWFRCARELFEIVRS